MNSVIFLILRQMRTPLLLLSTVYAIATVGLTLIPGVDDEGNVHYMSLFHAFYFVSYMGSTIGFGEIPYAFSDAQRLWALIFIYITVATWIYALGALISLLGNETLQRALTEYRFRLQVRMIREPFFLICGYGDTGGKLVRSLRNRLLQATVIEILPERRDALMLDDDPMFVPGLCGDASDPDNLLLAGLDHPMCQCVVALTNDNAVNLHIAISAKVINPNVKVICRADSHDVESNMASFGTDHIIDPFDTFARNLSLATYAPHQLLLDDWFRKARGEPLSNVTRVPHGLWIICGFGRFGKAIHHELTRLKIPTHVIEPNATIDGLPSNTIIGTGTESRTLAAAGVDQAVGIIAGSDDDSNNLSIIVTAKDMNPGIFTIVRQTSEANSPLFDSAGAQILMEPSDVIASKIRTLLTNPVIDDFLSLARAHDDDWARELAGKLRDISSDVLPHTWSITVDDEQAAAVAHASRLGREVRIGDLVRSHVNREEELAVIVLLHSSATGAFCMPDADAVLTVGDKLLFAGTQEAHSRMLWNLMNDVALHYVMTGTNLPRTSIGRWLNARAA